MESGRGPIRHRAGIPARHLGRRSAADAHRAHHSHLPHHGHQCDRYEWGVTYILPGKGGQPLNRRPRVRRQRGTHGRAAGCPACPCSPTRLPPGGPAHDYEGSGTASRTRCFAIMRDRCSGAYFDDREGFATPSGSKPGSWEALRRRPLGPHRRRRGHRGHPARSSAGAPRRPDRSGSRATPLFVYNATFMTIGGRRRLSLGRRGRSCRAGCAAGRPAGTPVWGTCTRPAASGRGR